MKSEILVVDDHQDQVAALRDLLDTQFVVLPATGVDPSTEALTLWRRHERCRLAIVDLKMPAGEGQVADESVGLKLVRQLKTRMGSRVAVRSAVHTHENLALAIRDGADAFIGKRWRSSDLLANVAFLQDWVDASSSLWRLSRSLASRDPFMFGHSTRVREFCRGIIPYLHFLRTR
jgi:CheY-like chemotaxis protein